MIHCFYYHVLDYLFAFVFDVFGPSQRPPGVGVWFDTLSQECAGPGGVCAAFRTLKPLYDLMLR